LVVLTAPLLSRLFGPAEFGVLGLYLSLVGILFTVSTFRYEMAITLAPGKRSAGHLFWLVVAISGGCSALIWLLMVMIPQETLPPQMHVVRQACWLIPIGVFVRCVAAAADRVACTQHAFGRLGLALFAGRVIDVSVKLALGIVLQLGWLGLAIGVVVGELVTTIAIVLMLRNWRWLPDWRLSRYRHLARRYRDFPRYNLPAALSSALGTNLPVLAFFALFDPVTAGLFELTQRVLGRPISMFGQHVYSVFYQYSVGNSRDQVDVGRLVEKVLPALFVTMFLPFLLVTVSGPFLFTVIFGPQWREAGAFAAVLAPAWFLRSIATPVRVFNTFERQSLAFGWQLITLLGIIAALALGAWSRSPMITVGLLSLVNVIAYAIHLSITVKLSQAKWKRIAYGPVRLTTALWQRLSLAIK
jgi:O-antigen/teichoic acid export membrane protein